MTVAVLLNPHSVAGQAHHELHTQESPVVYNEVVDRVFEPSLETPLGFKEFQRRIGLRFLPAWGLESQVVILDKGNGVFRVVRFRLKKGTPSISEEYDRVLRSNAKATIEDITRRLSSERRESVASDSVARLVANLSRLSIPVNLSTDLTLDGTTYELWIQTPSNEIHAVFSDGAYGEATNSSPIIQWMKAVHEEVAKSNQASLGFPDCGPRARPRESAGRQRKRSTTRAALRENDQCIRPIGGCHVALDLLSMGGAVSAVSPGAAGSKRSDTRGISRVSNSCKTG